MDIQEETALGQVKIDAGERIFAGGVPFDVPPVASVDDLPRKRSTTRERLIAAATELMWRDGVGDTSVDAILERAGVLRGSLYHFFPGKGDLLLECLERVWRWQDETMTAIHADAPTAEEGLVRHVELIFAMQVVRARELGFVPGNFNMSIPTSLLREDPRISGKLRQLMESNRRHMEIALDKIARSRSLRFSVPETARMLSYAINGAILAARMENSLDPLGDLRLIIGDVLGISFPSAAQGESENST